MLYGSTVVSTDQLLKNLVFLAMSMEASDIHLKHGARPRFRIGGELLERRDIIETNASELISVPEDDLPVLDEHELEKFLKLLDQTKATELREQGSYCASTTLARTAENTVEMENTVRVRMNYVRSQGHLSIFMRLIPMEVPDPSTLGIPQTVRDFGKLQSGLVIICGTQGQGKSTTLASLVEELNRTEHRHIVTIEDPVEFIHKSGACEITQRDIGRDSTSFTKALSDVARMDANVVIVGEVRVEHEMEIVLTLAEAGLLVFATLHSRGATEALERAVNMFAHKEKAQYRLASVLNGITCQQLIKMKDGPGRALASEILIASPALRSLIRTGDFKSVSNEYTSSAKLGTIRMEESIARLRQAGKIA